MAAKLLRLVVITVTRRSEQEMGHFHGKTVLKVIDRLIVRSKISEREAGQETDSPGLS
jgi:hypothetical protein